MPDKDEWAEADALADEVAKATTGQPLYRKPADGIKAMTERLRMLRGRLTELKHAVLTPARESALHELEREIAEAERRLAEYTRLHESRN